VDRQNDRLESRARERMIARSRSPAMLTEEAALLCDQTTRIMKMSEPSSLQIVHVHLLRGPDILMIVIGGGIAPLRAASACRGSQ
jgi:hypothetical protein